MVDCQDVRKQAAWWAQALDWTVIHESDKECLIVPSWADDTVIRETPWERVGPGMVFVPVAEGKPIKNRLHIDLAPHISQNRDAEIERLSVRVPEGWKWGSPTPRRGRCWPTLRATSSACSALGRSSHRQVAGHAVSDRPGLPRRPR